MVNTRIYTLKDLDDLKVQEDIKISLQHGKNVVFPTETVYGIGANVLSQEGVNNIYKIKGRPSDNPLIMHLASSNVLDEYVYIKQDYVNKLIKSFWPGPLTLVFDKKTTVPNYFTGGLDTVGVRIPGSDIARKIIQIANVPICAPSANISGRPSGTLFKHVLEDFNHKVDILIDGGKSEVGLESTVLDVTKEIPVILRPGMITYDMISDVVGKVYISNEINENQIPKAPGMKYKHYAPKGKLMIVEGDPCKVVSYINKKIDFHKSNNQSVGVIITRDYKHLIHCDCIYEIGSADNEIEIASNIFASLREMDSKNIEYIYSFSFNQGIYSEAIMNRLLKAANNNIIKV